MYNVQVCLVQREKHALDGEEPMSPKKYHLPPAGTVEKGQEKHGCDQDCIGGTEACKDQRILTENESTENAKITFFL